MLLMMIVILGALIMGIYDGGDITAAVLLAMFFVPAMFKQKKARGK